jgi:hypothetical protein
MLIGGLTSTSPGSVKSTSYLGPFLTSQSNTTESNVQQVVPVAGTISGLFVDLGEDPGTGNSWTFTIRKKSGPGVTQSTSVTCLISGNSATSCNSAALSVTFVAGDLISLQATPNSEPDSWNSARWSVSLTE